MRALDKLANVVEQAEKQHEAEQARQELEAAKQELEAAKLRHSEAVKNYEAANLEGKEAQQQIQRDERTLAELRSRAEAIKTHFQGDTDIDQLIEQSDREIRRLRERSQRRQKTASEEAHAARAALDAAVERVRLAQQRIEQTAATEDGSEAPSRALAEDPSDGSPWALIGELETEIDTSERYFGTLSKEEQHAQLTIWAGRARRLQDSMVLNDAERGRLVGVFGRLNRLSREYMPGYVDALNRNYFADWSDYIARAEEAMKVATEKAVHQRELEVARREQEDAEQRRLAQLRLEAEEAFQELRAVIAARHLPHEGVDEFRAALARVLRGYDPRDAELLNLVRPYEELVEGSEFRALRRALRKEEIAAVTKDATKQYGDLLNVTNGLKVLMIGGSPREENRQQLESTFGFEELVWEPCEGKQPALLDGLEARVQSGAGGVDVVLLLTEFVGHHVQTKLKPAAERAGVPFLMVPHGYGANQIAQVLRDSRQLAELASRRQAQQSA